MAKPTKRLTLYRMTGETTLDSAVPAQKLKGRNVTDSSVSVADQPGRLIIRSASTPIKWISDIKTLTAKRPALSRHNPSVILLIQDKDNTIWGLTWGHGFHLLDSEKIDFRFGARIVARAAIPDEVKALTKTILDHRARVDRSSLPAGDTVRSFGVDGYGEVISRIEAKARIPGLTVGDETIQLRASDSLNLPLALTPEQLLSDLQILTTLLSQPIVPGLESLEQLVALKPQDPKNHELDKELIQALTGDFEARLGLSWPHEWLDQFGPVVSTKITGIGDHRSRVFTGIPDISDIKKEIDSIPSEQLLPRLKKIQLELHSENQPDDDSTVSTPLSLRRWLICEIERDHQRYCLHNGSWYRMDTQYLDQIDDQVTEILSQKVLEMPRWESGDEAQYNKEAARKLEGYCLDRTRINTPLHPGNGIEPCDIFVPPGTLIHVKRGTRSAALSHLLAQGLVSTDALIRDLTRATAVCHFGVRSRVRRISWAWGVSLSMPSSS